MQDERIKNEDTLNSIITNAQQSGITQFIVNGCWQDDWQRVISLSSSYPNIIIPQLGLHPWWVGRRSTNWLAHLRQSLIDNPHAGLGECGLDKGPKSPKDTTFEEQLECFESQLRLAQELRRPVSIHCVRAYGNLVDSIEKINITVPIVLHAWTGSGEMTKRFSKFKNIYFSFGGYLTRMIPSKAIEIIRLVPRDKCLIESDSPDGQLILGDKWFDALPGLRDIEQGVVEIQEMGMNVPSSVVLTAKLVAMARGEREEDVMEVAYENARKIFCSSFE